MDSNTPSWGHSVRRIADAVLGLVQSRLELFALELEEEKWHTLRALLWLALGGGLLATGGLVAVTALGIFLWEAARYAGLIGLAILLMGAGGLTLQRLRRALLSRPRPFAQSISEFRKDRECLLKHD